MPSTKASGALGSATISTVTVAKVKIVFNYIITPPTFASVPIPLLETPNFAPSSIKLFTIFPYGISKIRASPIKLLPSGCRSLYHVRNSF